MPPARLRHRAIPPELAAIHAANPAMRAGHIVTGPIAIAGAEPGDMLEIRIEKIELGRRLGILRLPPARRHAAGGFPRTLPESHPGRPGARAPASCLWGTELALAPFFGVMGVAPPPAFGTIFDRQPRVHGGNLDNKELTAGSTLYLPVWVPGANFSVGDGHGVQGDGEVCINALEMCLTGTFTFVLHKGGGARDRC